jgi:hypothetical protein
MAAVNPAPVPPAAAGLAAGPLASASTALTNFSTSSGVMRPCGPLPGYAGQLAGFARNLRIDGARAPCQSMPVQARQPVPRRAGAGAAQGPLRQAHGLLVPVLPPGRWSRCRGCRRRRCCAFGGIGDQQHRAFGDLVADLDLELLDHARMARRDFHAGLVRLDRDQRLVDLDGVARLDQQFDDGHVRRIPMSAP